MSEAFKIPLSLSCSGALLILVLLLCRPLFRGRLSKRWQYYIWLVVVARLLLPLAPEMNLMGAVFQKIDNGATPNESISFVIQDTPSAPTVQDDDSDGNPGSMGSMGSEPPQTPYHAASGKDEVQNKQLWTAGGLIVGLVWLVVALILMIRKITIYQSFVKYIKAGCVEVEDLDRLEQFGRLVEQSGVKTAVELSTNHLISSPLLIGFFRPCIVLPTEGLTESEFQYTILHELTHFKRRDMFYKWLVQFTICMHWFNPFVHLMGGEVERACELSCDEAVIQNLDPQGRRAYGDTLLSAIGSGGSYKNAIASVTLGESKDKLAERLDAIKGFRKPSRLVVSLTAVLTVAICFGAAAAGAYALPLSALGTVSQAKPQTIGPLTLTTKEYTLEELNAREMTSLVIQLYSDDISVVRGGDTLKFEYYALDPAEYAIEPEKVGSDGTWYLAVRRAADAVKGERSMTITLPAQSPINIFSVVTTGGNISLTDCTASKIAAYTQSGEIVIQGGAVTELLELGTANGDATVSGTALPDSANDASYLSFFHTESGTIVFQPADKWTNYCYVIDYGEDANFIVNEATVEKITRIDTVPRPVPGEPDTDAPKIEGELQEYREELQEYSEDWIRHNQFTTNEDATKRIEFTSQRGTLMIQDR